MKKQPPEVFCVKKRYFKIRRKTSMLESLFNKVADLKACNFYNFQQRCFPVNFEKFSHRRETVSLNDNQLTIFFS